MQICLTTII